MGEEEQEEGCEEDVCFRRFVFDIRSSHVFLNFCSRDLFSGPGSIKRGS